MKLIRAISEKGEREGDKEREKFGMENRQIFKPFLFLCYYAMAASCKPCFSSSSVTVD